MNKDDAEKISQAAAVVASAALRAAKGDPYIAHRVLRVAAAAVCEMSGGVDAHPGALEVWVGRAVAILKRGFVAKQYEVVRDDALHVVDVEAEVVEEPKPRRLPGVRPWRKR